MMEDSVFTSIRKRIEEEHLPVFELASSDGVELDEFRNGLFANRNIYSMSKNFCATAIGILLDHHFLDESDTVYGLFARDYPKIDRKWNVVTIYHLLTQTTGIDQGFLDIDNHDEAVKADDFLAETLSHVLVHEPGTHFCYSDSNYYLLSRIVQKIGGMPYDSFLAKEVLYPLGITGISYDRNDRGEAMGATGMLMHARDVVKLGLLYSNYGLHNNQRILSEGFTKRATSPLVRVSDSVSYGFSFWRNEECPGLIEANGMNGQKMYFHMGGGQVVSWLAFDPKGRSLGLSDCLVDRSSGKGGGLT